MNKPDYSKVFTMIRLKAKQLAEDAGYGGEWGDRGASELLQRLEYFQYGLEGKLPPEWQKYWDSIKAEADPEWETYCRLKNKFKGK